MKPTVLIATFTALAGFSLGWLLKPAGTAGDASSKGSGESGQVAGGKSHERKDNLVLKPRGPVMDPESATADPEKSSNRMDSRRSIEAARGRTFKGRLTRFTEALGLSQEQKDAIEALATGRMEAFQSLAGSGRPVSEVVAAAADAERLFMREAEKVLDPEQYDALKAKIAREEEGSIQASALTDLSDLSRQIDLSPEQREKSMAAFLAGSKEAYKQRPEGWQILSESFSVFSGADSDMLDDMGPLLNDPEAMKDPQTIFRYQTEARRKDMEQKISQLGDILTPGQLAQYRAILNSRLTVIEQAPPPNLNKR
ncbi:hypothetical protein [Luteolibacter luteus]|uniref:Uncharacterized protein n=1 Tax=Luteolibacter luteus TaxID=2728835 RepID=A0A858RJH5_9BACT|nr:hypothetical protein [Luteolibacter luteus]QJE97002.1 hypothetical protein HHL09_14805 [Luteolibacter luteus]